MESLCETTGRHCNHFLRFLAILQTTYRVVPQASACASSGNRNELGDRLPEFRAEHAGKAYLFTECAPEWREKLLKHLTNVQLILVIGEYAQSYHMPDTGGSVTDRVQSWRDRWPDVVPLPHPSPRNNIWLKRNPWFDAELLPVLQVRIREILES